MKKILILLGLLIVCIVAIVIYVKSTSKPEVKVDETATAPIYRNSYKEEQKKALFESLSDRKKAELKEEVQRHMEVRRKIRGSDEDGHTPLPPEKEKEMAKERKRHQDEVQSITGVRMSIKPKDIQY